MEAKIATNDELIEAEGIVKQLEYDGLMTKRQAKATLAAISRSLCRLEKARLKRRGQ